MDQEEATNQFKLLERYRGNLAHLTDTVEYHGGWALSPLHVRNQVNDTCAKIAQIKMYLRDGGYHVIGQVTDNGPSREEVE